MNVLGISAHYHDAAAALISNGKVIAAAAEERFTRQKHDPSFPKFSIEFCLQQGGLTAQEVDLVVFYEDPNVKFTRVLASSLAPYPFSRSAFTKSMKSWLGSKLWIQNEISKKLDINPRIIEFIPHHTSHAAQAFIGSSFEEAAILTVDAVGEWASTALFFGKGNQKLELKQLEVIPYPHSLGLVYAVFTAFLGFQPNDGESNVMALAAFGKPNYVDKIQKIIRIQLDGTYRIDPSYFNFNQFNDIPYSTKFIKTFGSPRAFTEKLPFDSLLREDNYNISTNHQRFANIAASIQQVMEEAILCLVNKLYRITGSKNLCIAGGVALNCVAISRIIKESAFENCYIPPDPGDGGAALGAALYSYFMENSYLSPSDVVLTPFMGKQYDTARDVAMLEYIDPNCWTPFSKSGCLRNSGLKLDIKDYEYFNELLPVIVEDLEIGKIIGWFQGRFEYGPRALGNRSLLVDPKNIQAAKTLSQTVKSRASFRPYAFSVIEECASEVFELDNLLPHAAKWMQTVEKVKESAMPSVCAATHIDGTTRPQVCTKEDNYKYYLLLSAFGDATGTASLLNTSFNESGYPIVSSPVEALLVFARTNIDTLVINNLVIRRV